MMKRIVLTLWAALAASTLLPAQSVINTDYSPAAKGQITVIQPKHTKAGSAENDLEQAHVFVKKMGYTNWHYLKDAYFDLYVPSIIIDPVVIPGEVEMGFALVDKDENIKEIINVEPFRVWWYYENGSLKAEQSRYLEICKVTEEFTATDRFVFCVRSPAGEWVVAPHEEDAIIPMDCPGSIEDFVGISLFDSGRIYSIERTGRRVVGFLKPDYIAVTVSDEAGTTIGRKNYHEYEVDESGKIQRYGTSSPVGWYWDVSNEIPFFYCRQRGGKTYTITFYTAAQEYSITVTF